MSNTPIASLPPRAARARPTAASGAPAASGPGIQRDRLFPHSGKNAAPCRVFCAIALGYRPPMGQRLVATAVLLVALAFPAAASAQSQAVATGTGGAAASVDRDATQ